MEEKIIITCDSGIDMSEKLLKKYNIRLLPLVIHMGNEEYLDFEEAKPDDILKFHDDTGQLASTSAPTVEHSFRFFTRLVHMGYTVIHFSMSSGMSSAYDNAKTAAETFERVHVIDTLTASAGGTLLVIAAAEMLEEGKSSEEIIKKCKELIPLVEVPFMVHDMEFLYKGGRASFLANFLANIFNLKPSLYIDKDGRIVAGKKYSGKFEAIVPKMINDYFGNSSVINKKRLIIAHTGLSDEFLQSCKNEVSKHVEFKEIEILHAGCTITSHLGGGALVFSWADN